jgi:hypothetical protein
VCVCVCVCVCVYYTCIDLYIHTYIGMDAREARSAEEASRLVQEMTDGKPLSEDEIKDRLAKVCVCVCVCM